MMGCLYTGYSVSIRDVVLENGMGCSYTGCGVSVNGVLKNWSGY